ncbi:MAG TPA: YciI family protein [Gaiellaceae bacterium]|nr:YciI family protein [Gaiellaceae bacterium]
MQYVLLIYGEESNWSDLPPDELRTMYAEYMALASDLRARNKLLGTNQLHPVATATTVSVRDGEAIVTDGPFAETKEVLGGYFVVDADSLDDAIEWAQRIPAARHGRVEIRPAIDHTGDRS